MAGEDQMDYDYDNASIPFHSMLVGLWPAHLMCLLPHSLAAWDQYWLAMLALHSMIVHVPPFGLKLFHRNFQSNLSIISSIAGSPIFLRWRPSILNFFSFEYATGVESMESNPYALNLLLSQGLARSLSDHIDESIKQEQQEEDIKPSVASLAGSGKGKGNLPNRSNGGGPAAVKPAAPAPLAPVRQR